MTFRQFWKPVSIPQTKQNLDLEEIIALSIEKGAWQPVSTTETFHYPGEAMKKVTIFKVKGATKGFQT